MQRMRRDLLADAMHGKRLGLFSVEKDESIEKAVDDYCWGV